MSRRKLDYEKANRFGKAPRNSYVTEILKQKSKDVSVQKTAQKSATKKNFDKELFDMGKEFFDMGGKLEELDDKYKMNFSFIRGYEHGQRLAMIQEIDEKNNKKSR